jgi:cytochrome c oxidase subunit III
MTEETGEKDLRPLGLKLFLAGLTTLLGASLVGYLLVRLNAEVWPPPGIPAVPATLWISTGILILSSFTIHAGLSSIREGNQRGLRSGLVLTILLGVTFLGSQLLNGAAIYKVLLSETKDLYSFTFFLLTALHAIHVIGGFIPLGIVTKKAYAGAYSEAEHVGVRLTAVYWHYLDAVWIVMCVVLTV